jgi:hypothetical protein
MLELEKISIFGDILVSGCHHIIAVFLAHERGEFASVMSLFHSFCLRQFCSPLFGFFQLVPGFIELDQISK